MFRVILRFATNLLKGLLLFRLKVGGLGRAGSLILKSKTMELPDFQMTFARALLFKSGGPIFRHE
jgi:hypothetical protein